MRARCSILIGFMLVATLAVTGEVDAQTVSDAVKQDVSQPRCIAVRQTRRHAGARTS